MEHFLISDTSCFQGHMTSRRSGMKNFIKITIQHLYIALWVTNFHPFYSISYRFRDMGHFLISRSYDLAKVGCKKFCQNYYTILVYYPTGHKFSSVLLYLLPFQRYGALFDFKVTWPREGRMWKILSKLLYNTCILPYGSQIFVRFALSLTVSEIIFFDAKIGT